MPLIQVWTSKYTTPSSNQPTRMEPHALRVGSTWPDGNLRSTTDPGRTRTAMRYLEDVFDMKGQIPDTFALTSAAPCSMVCGPAVSNCRWPSWPHSSFKRSVRVSLNASR